MPTRFSSPIDDRLYSVAELAERWKCSAQTVRTRIEGRPGVMRSGRLIRVAPELIREMEKEAFGK
jgi:hypothetical protein